MSSKSLVLAELYLITQEYKKYTAEQHGVWSELVRKRLPQLEKYASREYLDGYHAIGLSDEHLPNLEDITALLKPRTSWSVVAVNGLIPINAFFEMLQARCCRQRLGYGAATRSTIPRSQTFSMTCSDMRRCTRIRSTPISCNSGEQ